ncbi:MAG: tetratricopeptide repeat protein [Candidatus Omnitrophica bacterium]|nr:tetratricopeptide repeat protein [Candidatus Omnitrophota bacterium]
MQKSCYKPNLFFPAITLLLLLGIPLYLHTFSSPFIFDGVTYIEENASIRNLKDLGAIFRFWPTRFITFLSFAINYYFHKTEVFGYHLVNLSLHLGTAILVFWFILLLFSTPKINDRDTVGNSRLIAFLSALIFVCHPIQTQAVTYIYQRTSSLAGLFYLLTLCFYLKARLLYNKTLVFYLFYIASLITTLLGMFTKETVFTLPFLILLLEIYFLKKEGRLTLKYVLPFLLLLVVIPLTLILTKTVYFKAQGILADKNIPLQPRYYFLTQFKVFITYIRLLFIPINQNLDYDYPISKSLFEIPTFISLVLLFIILITTLRLYSRYPLISFGILWFFLSLLPESSLITLNDVINEHRLYLPMVGFSLFLITSLYHLLRDNLRLFIVLIAILLVFYSSLTYFRNIIWKDELTLWSDTVEKSPNKARPYNGRGTAYSKKGQYEKAIADFTKALEINPKYISVYNNRGDAFSKKEEYEKAIADFTEALKVDPEHASTYYNRGTIYAKKAEYEKAIADFTEALKINPRDEETLNNRGATYAQKGQYDKAISDFTEGLKIKPEDITLYINRGAAYSKKAEYEKAISDFNKILTLDPKYPDAYYNLANIYLIKKEYGKAEEYVEKLKDLGYKVNPEFIESLRKPR